MQNQNRFPTFSDTAQILSSSLEGSELGLVGMIFVYGSGGGAYTLSGSIVFSGETGQRYSFIEWNYASSKGVVTWRRWVAGVIMTDVKFVLGKEARVTQIIYVVIPTTKGFSEILKSSLSSYKVEIVEEKW